ncbi:MFS transporter [Actinomadura madurae]|uniref:MFS transporter n=1 Tax=Actinomadura madurae TaxID=1993 RepID=UPI0020265BF6|nr:MFS transporter [Actinomadura madurae]URN00088.1 MFS transporter [Actinomadura madurae]URN02248.1 MFS transporter [Actinomadura madurae]
MAKRWLLVVLLTGQTMVSMDGSIVAVAMPDIASGLHASGALLQLVTGGYIFALAVLVVTGARLGDKLGHRTMFFLGLFGFTAASLACGLTPNGAVLVAARVFQGASAALLLPQVLSLIQLSFEGPARARALGLYSMVLALGVALGQIVGGVIVTVGGSWRPIFLVNVPVGALLLGTGPRLMPPAAGRKVRLDIPGVGLLSFGMAALIVPLVLGREQGWPFWTWPCLAAGSVVLGVFCVHELRVSSPLLDLSVLRRRSVRPGLFAACAVMGAYTGFLFTLALYLQNVLHFSPLEAGLTFVPYTVGFATAGLGWTRLPLRARTNLPTIGLLCFAVAVSILSVLAGDGWPVFLSIPLLFAAGAGHAAGFSPLVDRITGAVGPAQASSVSALTNTGTLLSNVLAIALFGGVYLSSPTTLTHVTVPLAALIVLAAAVARNR